jgi:plastocyanin
LRWLLAVVATLAFAPAAYAQGATVQAVDDTSQWSPAEVTIKAGETVTWTWDGEPPHNVKSTTSNWDVLSTATGFAHMFGAPGTYDYLCQFHPGMTGRVIVTDTSGSPPPAPPPPPLSEQPWANDQQPPTVVEVADETRPRLSAVRVTAVRDGARARFRLSERARVTLRLKRAGITIEAVSRTLRSGAHRLTVRNRRLSGRYRVEVVARDLAGNRSSVERARVMLR